MNYYFVSLARNYNLIDDEAIEKWAYKNLEGNHDSPWWFSYLISARTLDSVNSILRDAASESEVEESPPYCFKYVSVDSWCRFLNFVNSRSTFRSTISGIVENADNSDCLESVLLYRVLKTLERSSALDGGYSSKLWIDLFQNEELKYFDLYIVPMLKEFNVDARKWLNSSIKYD